MLEAFLWRVWVSHLQEFRLTPLLPPPATITSV
jgi:hypothetical protein